MEARAIVKSFEDSKSLHNIVYKNFVSDGDSSAISAVLKADPYQKYGITVKKNLLAQTTQNTVIQ